jgi:hypothetical protein
MISAYVINSCELDLVCPASCWCFVVSFLRKGMVAMKYMHTAGGKGVMVIQELDLQIEYVQYRHKV